MLPLMYATLGYAIIAARVKSQEDLCVLMAAACMIQSFSKLCREVVPATSTNDWSVIDLATAWHDSYHANR